MLVAWGAIYLTCITCKLMKRTILRRITFHLLDHNFLPSEQYGFRRGHCTILYLVQRARDVHNMKPTTDTLAFFLDLSKDFAKEQLLQSKKIPSYLEFTLDIEINCNKHIQRLCEKDRKRLQLLKHIYPPGIGERMQRFSTITYTAPIRPVLEYDFQIYQVAADSNLKKLVRVQLSAARIITGLRHCCPNDIVLHEADLKPLSLRRRTICANTSDPITLLKI
ncbi:RNase H domain-containing protein [Nephila pilipes]|uniref:RNase H domain-containing protein n=1 Tax=Nephila pilipes TaxID=299642 RepID=A0A8X6MYQ8_NEPPI|nr:RNase H domain-containing protein [Nephila pilipes]